MRQASGQRAPRETQAEGLHSGTKPMAERPAGAVEHQDKRAWASGDAQWSGSPRKRTGAEGSIGDTA